MIIKNKKELEVLLSNVPRFPKPKQFLEQYVCDSRIASEVMWHAYISGDIKDKIVADFGCGTGLFAYAAYLLGSREVMCIDIDCEALSTAKSFLDSKNAFNINYLCSDVELLNLRGVDTVVMNPPFGVYKRGIDMVFLESALKIKPAAIYTIHKYSHKLLNIVENKLKLYGDAFKMLPLFLDMMIIHATYVHHRRNVYRFPIVALKIVRV
ncbi:METTL5 family protein [Ignisphaera sp. 4213-co]|uniref:Methyltransferase-like protein 5 n=1 Tax=Ignisphaera cupida TaxID=3050454 RepID=A0ABD4Z815_9CREN|nr:METTL5 family protein [Ignisphaera sp. 4213-co]MDK6029497.1 METTL5 family protein [Ignisphaera sp. 4213-co]